MNKQLIESHKTEILELFKTNFKNLISRNVQIELLFLVNETLNELNIHYLELSDIYFLKEWFDLIYNQSFIHHLIINNFDINEFIFHAKDNCQLISSLENRFVEIISLSEDEFQLSLEILANKNNITWNFTNPFTSFQIFFGANSFRATLIHHSLSPNKQSKLFLRKHGHHEFSLNDFSDQNEVANLINNLIEQKKNILISGSTGSGKTTLLKTLIQKLPKTEHVIILEDTHELEINAPQVTNLISDDKHSQKSLKEYCTYAMRMSPDRIILGEMRGYEVIPFLLAMNTGHKGLMSTIHANSAIDSIHRLNLLFGFFSGSNPLNPEYITKLICQNIDYVLHIEKNKIKEIIKVLGAFENTPMTEVIYQLSA